MNMSTWVFTFKQAVKVDIPVLKNSIPMAVHPAEFMHIQGVCISQVLCASVKFMYYSNVNKKSFDILRTSIL